MEIEQSQSSANKIELTYDAKKYEIHHREPGLVNQKKDGTILSVE